MDKRQSDFEAAERATQERSESLIMEFRAHLDELLLSNPEFSDRKHDIFEGWAIQKIAGLQEAVEFMGKDMAKVRASLKIVASSQDSDLFCEGNPLN